MKTFIVAALSVLSFTSSACANLAGPARPPVSQEAVEVASLLSESSTGTTTFQQLIDHNNPSFGTFPQRYWYNTEFWNGPGSPVIVFNPGEVPVLGPNGDFTGYLYNTTLIGQYAQAVGGAAIVIEHRYWGESSPYTDLTAENLQFLTVPQAVQDMTNFAKTVSLPFDTTGNTNAPQAPWALVGGSYSGSLAAWTEITAPGTFWAYHASSAPVQAIENFWEYFQPIQQGIPKACSNDIIAVISHVDEVLATGSAADRMALKTMFGLGTVVHDADFARTLTLPLDLWQLGVPEFMVFCEALEGVPAGQVSLTSTGIGLAAALPNFASYIAATQGCTVPDCYDSYNSDQALYTTTEIDTGAIAGRQWQWMLCNEAFGYWQTAAPAGMDSLVSRLVTADYYQQQCNFFFPGVQFGLTEDAHNAEYMGWDISGTTRLMFSSGEFDPWRSAGVSSEFRPGGPLASTPDIPVFIVPGGIHTQDLFMADITPEIAALQVQEVAQMKRWIGDFYTKTNITSSSVSSTPTSVKTSLSSSNGRPTSSATVTSSSSSRIIRTNSTISSTRPSTTFASSGIFHSSSSSRTIGTNSTTSSRRSSTTFAPSGILHSSSSSRIIGTNSTISSRRPSTTFAPSGILHPSSSSRIVFTNSTLSSTKPSTTFGSSIRSSIQSHGTTLIITGSSNTSVIHSTPTSAPYTNSTRSSTQSRLSSSILSSVVSKVIQPSSSISTSHSLPNTTSTASVVIQSSNILSHSQSITIVTESIQTVIPSAVSTVYVTESHTIVSCHPSVTSCPASSTRITTQIVSISTTICPLNITSSTPSILASSVSTYPIYSSVPAVAHPASSSIISVPTTTSIRTRPNTSSSRSSFASASGTGIFHGSRNSTGYYPTASAPRSTGTGASGGFPSASGSRPVVTISPYVGPGGALPAPEQPSASHTPVAPSAPVQFTGAAKSMEVASVGLFSVGVLAAFLL